MDIPCGAPPCCAVMDCGTIREKSSEGGGGGGGGGGEEADPPPPQAVKETRNRTQVAMMLCDTLRAKE